ARILDCIALGLLFAATGLDVPWAASAFVLLAIAFAVLIPLTPGHLGTLEAAIVGALGVVGVPLAAAVACALLFHAQRVISIALLGLTGVSFVADARDARDAHASRG